MQAIHRATLVGMFTVAGLGLLASACSSDSGGGGGSGGSGGSSASGGSGGRGGAGGSGGSTGGSSGGSGGSTGGSSGGSGGSTGGSGGSSGGSGGATGGSGGARAARGGSGGAGGSGGSSGGDAKPAEMGQAEAGGTSNRILFYTRSTSQVHAAALTAAVAEMMKLLAPAGLTGDAINDPAMITAANLAKYAGVVMVNNGAQPFGTPGTAQTQALVDFVRGGGGLAAFHAASTTGDNGPLGMLLGGNRTDPGGDFRTTDCFPEAGAHPTVAKLPMPYRVMNEEYYTFTGLNAANQVVLRCSAANGNDRIPITWVREEGVGPRLLHRPRPLRRVLDRRPLPGGPRLARRPLDDSPVAASGARNGTGSPPRRSRPLAKRGTARPGWPA